MTNTPLASLSFPDIPLQLLDSMVFISISEISVSTSEQPNIVIIGATVFLYISKLLGSSNFELYLCFSDIQTNSTKLAEAPDLSNVFSKYHKFTDIFSKTKAKVFASYHPYNLQINLEEGTQPLFGPIYSFLTSEQEAFKEFIEENLNIGFIQPISSLYNVLVLFIKKKDSLLCQLLQS